MAIKIGNKAVTAVYKGTTKVNGIIRNNINYLTVKEKGIFEKATGMTMLQFINRGYAESGKAYDSQGNEVENWSSYWNFYTSTMCLRLKDASLTKLPTEIPVIVDRNIVLTLDRLLPSYSAITSLDLSNYDSSNVIAMSYMLYNCNKLKEINFGNLDTSKVTTMEFMFSSCSSLTELDLSNFNTSNVNNMYAMFFGCTNLKSIYVGDGWNTSNVTNTNDMFKECGTSSVTKI